MEGNYFTRQDLEEKLKAMSDLTPHEPALIPKPDGYRKMSDAEFALFNEITAHANATQALIDEVMENSVQREPNDGLRWAAIAKTQLQQGYMALKRAVALPANF